MKSLIVFGAGHNGAQLAKMLNNPAINHSLGDLQIKYFTCNTREKWGSYYCGLPVVSPVEMLKHLDEVDGICVSTPANVDDIMKQLLDMGVTKPVYLTPGYVYEYLWGPDMPALVEMDITKPRLPHLNLLCVEGCNLNCKGCFSADSRTSNRILTPHEVESMLNQVKHFFSGVRHFEFFGGEPLLHNELDKLLYIARRNMPDTEIVIYSNGLLIPGLARETLQSIAKLDIHFCISLYPVTGVIKNQIDSVLTKHGIKYVFTPPIYTFRKSICEDGNLDPEEMFYNCPKAVFLSDGWFCCGCTLDLMRKEYPKPVLTEYRRVNVNDTQLDGWEINKIFERPSEECKYCSYWDLKYAPEFPWSANSSVVNIGSLADRAEETKKCIQN